MQTAYHTILIDECSKIGVKATALKRNISYKKLMSILIKADASLKFKYSTKYHLGKEIADDLMSEDAKVYLRTLMRNSKFKFGQDVYITTDEKNKVIFYDDFVYGIHSEIKSVVEASIELFGNKNSLSARIFQYKLPVHKFRKNITYITDYNFNILKQMFSKSDKINWKKYIELCDKRTTEQLMRDYFKDTETEYPDWLTESTLRDILNKYGLTGKQIVRKVVGDYEKMVFNKQTND